MNDYEDNIIILLRKIVALSIPQDFEATDDTSRIVLLEKLKYKKEELFQKIDNYIIAFETFHDLKNNIQLKESSHVVWKMQYKIFNGLLATQNNSIIEYCNKSGINISYEINKLME